MGRCSGEIIRQFNFGTARIFPITTSPSFLTSKCLTNLLQWDMWCSGHFFILLFNAFCSVFNPVFFFTRLTHQRFFEYMNTDALLFVPLRYHLMQSKAFVGDVSAGNHFPWEEKTL